MAAIFGQFPAIFFFFLSPGLWPLGFFALELSGDNIHQDTLSAFPHIVSMLHSSSKNIGRV